MKYVKWFFIALVTTLWSCTSDNISLKIINELDYPQVTYAIKQLEASGTRRSGNHLLVNRNLFVITTSLSTDLEDEAFEIKVKGMDIHVAGGDANGIMYGLFHIKEQLDFGSNDITNHKESPALPFRAIKFNLPWDSYRRGEALQLHYETCRDTLFWRDFLDMLAENRFNTLTLWNLHPFNYLVKTEKYPEACVFTDQEMQEWKQFWSTLFKMAKNRGVETYLVNWNIFVSPEFAKAHGVANYSIDGTYYVEKGDTAEIIKDYTREVVREVINQYPDLTGLGITLGEGMGGMQAAERQQWLLDTFLEGMRSANRKIKFIHRAPLSAGTGSQGSTDASVERLTRNTLDTLTCTDGPVTIELKFNWSHAYSSPSLVKVHGGELTDAYWNPEPVNYRLAWMMRNEDFFILRWGQPDFIRQHIAYNAHPWVNGYFIGSETYIPAKDYISALPNSAYKYAFERQWMYYKMWGRLLYNPNTTDKTFIRAFESRFPGLGEMLFNAQTKVSRVPLIIASYWNATWDYTLYTEGLLFYTHDGTKYRMKLLSLEEMTRMNPLEPSYLSVDDFIASGRKSVSGRISPFELADSLDAFCADAISIIEKTDTDGDTNLLYERSDIKTWANLGMYFSDKLRSSVYYREFQISGDREYHEEAVYWLEKATAHWFQVVEITNVVYKPVPLQHYELNDHASFHWSEVAKEVQEELLWLKSL